MYEKHFYDSFTSCKEQIFGVTMIKDHSMRKTNPTIRMYIYMICYSATLDALRLFSSYYKKTNI